MAGFEALSFCGTEEFEAEVEEEDEEDEEGAAEREG